MRPDAEEGKPLDHSKSQRGKDAGHPPRWPDMNVWSKLQSPIALALQGFVAGGILFFTLQPLAGADREPPSTSGGSVLSTLQV